MDKYNVFLKHAGGFTCVNLKAESFTEKGTYLQFHAGDELVGQFVKADVMGFEIRKDKDD